MENDSCDLETDIKAKTQRHGTNAGHILQPSWIRCAFQMGYGYDRFLLDYGRNFLPYVSGIIYFILLLI